MTTTITAKGIPAEHLVELVDGLAELVATAPPPGPLRLTVRRRNGSKARTGHVLIGKGDVGKAWVLGTLAHEYAHVLDPEGPAGLNRVALRAIVPSVAAWAVAVLCAAVGQIVAFGVAIAAALVLLERGWRRVAIASQAAEYRADRRGAELLGLDGVDHLVAMLDQIKDRDGHDWWRLRRRLDTHPHPDDRLAAIR